MALAFSNLQRRWPSIKSTGPRTGEREPAGVDPLMVEDVQRRHRAEKLQQGSGQPTHHGDDETDVAAARAIPAGG